MADLDVRSANPVADGQGFAQERLLNLFGVGQDSSKIEEGQGDEAVAEERAFEMGAFPVFYEL
ncbi:hypothetical protein DSTSK_43180 [Desulforhabdus sp. TSK]|nr:hypothetical protein DSTSK_43180 [Desulforhabdus sp. TSK]